MHFEQTADSDTVLIYGLQVETVSLSAVRSKLQNCFRKREAPNYEENACKLL